VQDLIIADLARSGLVPEDMKVTLEGNTGYRIPYFLPTGELHPYMYRIRRFDAAEDGSKYFQAAGVPPYPYFTPGADWRGLQDQSIIRIIEGEKKAAAAWKFLRMTAIGVGGCHNWKGPKNPRVFRSVSPVILEALPPHATVEIIFDGDYRRNRQVEHGLAELCLALRDAGHTPIVVTLPEGRDGKVGFDDWLVATNGVGFEALPRHDGKDLWDGLSSLAYRTRVTVRTNDDGSVTSIIPNGSNAALIFSKHDALYGKFWYDEAEQVPYYDGKRLEDDHLLNLGQELQRHVNPMFKSSVTTEAIYSCFGQPAFRRNPLTDYLNSLVWDGTPRLDTLLENYFNAVDDRRYLSAVGHNWMISLVGRALRPGLKADSMLILEGRQGIGKSRALRVLGGQYYREATVHDMGSKDFLQNMAGAWIYDINELRSLKKTEHSTIKSLLSSSEDAFRLPYGRTTTIRKRSCVIVGTTNEDTYLTDDTGGRRFWPVKCGYTVEVDMLERDRDQLLAEAAHLFKKGESWWEMPKDVTEMIVAARAVISPLTEVVARATADYLALPRYKAYQNYPISDVETVFAYVTTSYVYAFMQLDNSHVNAGRDMQISSALRATDFEKVRVQSASLPGYDGSAKQCTIFRKVIGPATTVSLVPNPPKERSKLS